MIKRQTTLLSLVIYSVALSGTGFAASLIVDAVVSPWTGEIAYLGNTNYSIPIWISVQNLAGISIADLNITDFRISKLMAPKEFYNKNISIVKMGAPFVMYRTDLKIYEIRVAPDNSEKWADGWYLLFIEVSRNDYIGQKMLPLTVAESSSIENSSPVASSPPPKIGK